MSSVEHGPTATRTAPVIHLAWGVLALALMTGIGFWAFQFRAAQPPVPLIWPAAGLTLALTWRGGPAAAVGAAFGTAWLHTRLGTALPPALVLGALTGAAGLASVALLRRIGFAPGLARVRDALLLLAVGGGLTALVNALGGAAVMSGLTPEFADTFGLCWIADLMGLILLAPPILAAERPPKLYRRHVEAAAWVGLGTLFVFVVYGGTLSAPIALTLSYAVFPLALAVALRFGAAVTGLVVLAIAAVSLACTGLDKGPFAQGNLTANLLSLHAHLAMLGLTGLILASARSERDQAEVRAREHLGLLARAGRLDAMSSMAAGIAHELNQPLSAVNSYAQAARRMLQEGRRPDEVCDTLDRIVAGNERAADIVRGIRGFLRSGEGKREHTDLNRLTAEAIDLVVAEYRRRHVALISDRKPGRLPMEVDPVSIRQVILNLLQNALEAVTEKPGDHPRVRVITRLSDDGHWAELTVEDNGPGLPDEDRHQLFEPLVTHREGGTGLGLAIVRSLVEAHEGNVEAGNREGGGARFRIRLPADMHRGKSA